MIQNVQILVVDDESSVRTMLEAVLRTSYNRVDTAANGVEARKLLNVNEYDLVMLDLRLGDVDGIDLLQEVKQRWPALEVILLTAYSSINSAILALRAGAFDYMLKPAQVPDIRACVERGLERRRTTMQRGELLQRISESIRVLGAIDVGSEMPVAPLQTNRIEIGPLTLDLQRHSAVLGKHTLALTRIEFALLTALVKQPDTTLSYSVLSEAAYGRSQPEDEARTLLRPHIARLRHKLESIKISGVTLTSVRGTGYMLQTD